MSTYRIMRQSDPQSAFDVLWDGDAYPEAETVEAACEAKRTRVRDAVRSPFAQKRNDYLFLQRRRPPLINFARLEMRNAFVKLNCPATQWPTDEVAETRTRCERKPEHDRNCKD